MNNIEQNALRIAELMGYKKPEPVLFGGSQAEWINNRNTALYEKEATTKFSQYNGLMPIVFECNKSNQWEIYIDNDVVTLFFVYNQKLLPQVTDKNYDTETEFIQAIQLVVIKYLELKNDSGNN